jgi:hypothetical protein
MSARTVTVTLFNNLENTQLILVGSGLSHGEWGAQPPEKIPAATDLLWSSQSDGFLTGTQGWARYYPVRLKPPGNVVPPQVPDDQTIYIAWDNPFVGSDSYQISAPPPYVLAFVPGSGDEGNQDRLSFTLKGAFDGPLPGQHTCIEGYVWREAFPNDFTCVTPAARQQAADDNAAAASRKASSGSATCKQGYVWREARPGDEVCVTPETRAQTAQQNAEADQHSL